MIEAARTSFSDDSVYYLLWGYAVMIACIAQYLMMTVFHYEHHYISWAVVIPITLIAYFIIGYKDMKRQKVKTFVGEASGYLWTAVGFSFFALSFILSKAGYEHAFPFYILLYGIGTYVSGRLLSFKPMAIGGAACLVLAVVTAYLIYELQILAAALAILISYIIPGHMLRRRYRRGAI